MECIDIYMCKEIFEYMRDADQIKLYSIDEQLKELVNIPDYRKMCIRDVIKRGGYQNDPRLLSYIRGDPRKRNSYIFFGENNDYVIEKYGRYGKWIDGERIELSRDESFLVFVGRVGNWDFILRSLPTDLSKHLGILCYVAWGASSMGNVSMLEKILSLSRQNPSINELNGHNIILSHCLCGAFKKGRRDTIDWIFRQFTEDCWDEIFDNSKSHTIRDGKLRNMCFYYACISGRDDIISDYFNEDDITCDAFIGACRSNNIALVGRLYKKLIGLFWVSCGFSSEPSTTEDIEKAEYTEETRRIKNILLDGLVTACIKKRINVVKFILENIYHDMKYETILDAMNECMRHACQSDSSDLFDTIEEFAIREFPEYDVKKASICCSYLKIGYENMYFHLIKKFGEFPNGHIYGCAFDSWRIIDYMLEHLTCADNMDTMCNKILLEACQSGSINIMENIINRMKVDCIKCIKIACGFPNNYRIVKLLWDKLREKKLKIPEKFYDICIKKCFETENVDVIKLFTPYTKLELHLLACRYHNYEILAEHITEKIDDVERCIAVLLSREDDSRMNGTKCIEIILKTGKIDVNKYFLMVCGTRSIQCYFDIFVKYGANNFTDVLMNYKWDYLVPKIITCMKH